jgi:hypothetical protein
MAKAPHTTVRLSPDARSMLDACQEWLGCSQAAVIERGVRLMHQQVIQEQAAQLKAQQSLARRRKKSQEGA